MATTTCRAASIASPSRLCNKKICSRMAIRTPACKTSARLSTFLSSGASALFNKTNTISRSQRHVLGSKYNRNMTVSANLTLPIDLRGKKAFVAGVADDQGFGWAISKALAQAGAEVILGTWVPALNIFESSLRRGKFDESRVLSDGSLMEFAKVYPMDAVYDEPEDVPEDVRTNKRYAKNDGYTVSEVAARVKEDFGNVDIVVHSLANGPEVAKPLLETSRRGYLAAISASSYSLVSMVQRFGPMMNEGGAVISLTYLAGERVVPGYGGGMSSAKSALEGDTRVLAFEAGRKYKIRVNTISAGPLGSRAAKSIGFIDEMIQYSKGNACILDQQLAAEDVGNTAAFLCSPMAQAITGTTLYVDHGLHVMGLGTDGPVFGDSMDSFSEP